MAKKNSIFTIVMLLILTALLLCGCSREVKIAEGSTVTKTGTVTDHAMATLSGGNKIWDESYSYISIEFEDGTGLCAWNMNEIPEDVKIGDTVEITYGIKENSDLVVLIEIKEVE